MSEERKKKVSFIAIKEISKPIRVKFTTSSGERVSFTAIKNISRPELIEFYTRKKKK